ncbi:MAG: multiple sugar transport system permease protein [Candidatus Atribacteria bacterium]|nr:multiple sugar transport system permease protein [Candidatus Atribacteria bacterium]
MRSVKKYTLRSRIIIYTLLVIAGIFAVFPVSWAFLMSTRPNVEIFKWPPTFLPEKFTLEPYRQVFENPIYLRFFLNSYVVAMVVTLSTVIVAILAGYSFSRFNFPGKRLLNLFVVGTQMVPPITLLIPYFSMIVALKLFDTYKALFLTYIVLTLPYAILMMTGYFNTISKELDEAVMIDGGSRFYALWRVLVPLALPGIIATTVFSFLLSWNEFAFALTLTKSNSMRTIPVGISLLMGQHAYEWNVMMAVSILGSAPALVLYLVAQRYFLAGMTVGAIKE